MKLDAYTIRGRYIPAFFSIVIPVMIFNHFYTSEEFGKFVGDVLGAKIISNLTISSICLYYLSEAGRFFGKHLFERIYFKEELYMPTTSFLMFDDSTYSKDYKNKVRQKIYSDFKIRLLTEKEERANEELARTKIVETMALMRKKLHTNKFLLQHNIEYGAMRNAIGGSVLGVSFSILNIIFFSLWLRIGTAVYISIFTLCVYMGLIAFSKIIINAYGKSYAKILYREYMG